MSNDFKTHMIRKGLGGGLRMFIAFSAVFLGVHWLSGGFTSSLEVKGGGSDISVPNTTVQTGIPKNPDADSPREVWREHKKECWRGSDKPKAELPGAAIIQSQSTGKALYTDDPRLLDEAFNEALAIAGVGGEMSYQIDVVALCV